MEPQPEKLPDAELARIRAHLADENADLHDRWLCADARALLAEVDRLHGAGTLHIPESMTPLRPEDRVKLPQLPVREGFPEPLPDSFFAAMKAPTDMDNERRWRSIASVSAGLLMHLRTGAPYSYPEEGQRIEEFARGQLAEVAAAALLELLDHAVTTDDEQPLEAFTAAIVGDDRIPEEVAAAVGPALATIIQPVLGAIAESRHRIERSEA